MTHFVQPEKIEIDANERAVNEKSPYCFFVCTTFDSFLNDLKQHPNYKYTAEADRVKNVFDLDKLINRRRRPGLNEVCEVYEADGTDAAPISEDEDILNYDDVDDPDAFV